MQRHSKKSSPTIGIIADDLTGAGDTGVRFLSKGLDVSVLFAPEGEDRLSDVVVLDTDSRTQDREAAYALVSRAAVWMKGKGCRTVYKKVDSTLRGHIGVEIQAVMEQFEFDFAVIAPAYPKMGRTTVNGIQYVEGIPLHETEMARDPKTPVKESNLVRLLRQQSGEKTAHIDPRSLGDDATRWQEVLDRCREEGIRWLVFDARTDLDLALLVRQIKAASHSVLWVGSAGLAEHLLDSVPETGKEARMENVASGPVMAVAGSMAEVTRVQIQRALTRPRTAGVEVDPSELLRPRSEILDRYTAEMEEALRRGDDVIVHVSTRDDAFRRARRTGADLGMTPLEAGNRISEELARLTGRVIQRHEVNKLILTGGDTAKSVCRRLGARGISLRGEVEPGLPFGNLIGNPRRMTVTKAGAFGSGDSLIHAIHQLKGTKANV
ncbi:uncharacterized protein YgbK (DUF1537 family) [Melghirimyces profundicolus]|uniref:Uncharacterized protein YgbK (DUF1537 family) n=1 Tax=Melghirimyces profundicolus TaxID=1242148 RepID=A0A2T6C8F0_9BACL|nr:four-carbon acid sugar kinase family protein [Melghirimyces profundicolus]PTX64556.1 uncharacterized protein YgbK (DUF1537 family) [Melghirimyces profundicolus]